MVMKLVSSCLLLLGIWNVSGETEGVESRLMAADVRIGRPIQLLTLVHGGDVLSQFVLYPYLPVIRQALEESPIPRLRWEYRSGHVCDPSFTSGERNCLQHWGGAWTAPLFTAAWNTFVDVTRNRNPCTRGERDTFPLPQILANAAVSFGFAPTTQPTNRVMVIFTESGPDFLQQASTSFDPHTLRCQPQASIAANQFRSVFDQGEIMLFVIATPGAAKEWQDFRTRSGMPVTQMVVYEATRPNDERFRDLQYVFYSSIGRWDQLHPFNPPVGPRSAALNSTEELTKTA